MSFEKILVALDGSQNSQIAAEYGFWLAGDLDADLCGINVVDPRVADLFVEPEFAQELGYPATIESREKVMRALRKIGQTILDLFRQECSDRNLRVNTLLKEGYIVEEILNQEKNFDLLIVGHRGNNKRQMPTQSVLGSVAERVTLNSDMPVLITVQSAENIEQIVVAYDGSEPSKGALLMAENLAKHTRRNLKAITVMSDQEDKSKLHLLIEEGQSYLREYWPNNVFAIHEGHPAETLIGNVSGNSLLVLGAYGYNELDKNVLGTTTTSVIRQAETSVLVYKPNLAKASIERARRASKISAKI